MEGIDLDTRIKGRCFCLTRREDFSYDPHSLYLITELQREMDESHGRFLPPAFSGKSYPRDAGTAHGRVAGMPVLAPSSMG